MKLNQRWEETSPFCHISYAEFTTMIIKSRLFTCSYFKRWGWNVLCCIKCTLGVHKLLTSEVGVNVGNVVWGETQESATLTRKMWCELNMKTNELSHVQRCFKLPAPVSICPSGQQAWIKHFAREGKKNRGSPFPSRLAVTPETALWNQMI